MRPFSSSPPRRMLALRSLQCLSKSQKVPSEAPSKGSGFCNGFGLRASGFGVCGLGLYVQGLGFRLCRVVAHKRKYLATV